LLSSVDPVLYCDTNSQLTRLLFYRLLRHWFSVCFFAWAIADCALRCVSSHNGAFTVCALLQQAAMLFASFIMLYSMLWSYQFRHAMQLTQPTMNHQS
jgi:hypothetical protein